MPRYLLDASFCVQFLRGRPWARSALAGVQVGEVAVASVTAGELHACALRAEAPAAVEAFLEPLEVLPFGKEEARQWGQVEVRLQKQGHPLEPVDGMIAATALAHDLTLVTGNPRRFERVKGLAVVDWEDGPA